jgi:Domain of unknown function (DUF6916)
MVPILTEKDFSPHLNSKFYVQLADGSLELVLAEVQAYQARPTDQSGMERFSIFFDGPGLCLPQDLYHLKHDQMGELDIFLVPVSGNQSGYRYEAVFNSFK